MADESEQREISYLECGLQATTSATTQIPSSSKISCESFRDSNSFPRKVISFSISSRLSYETAFKQIREGKRNSYYFEKRRNGYVRSRAHKRGAC